MGGVFEVQFRCANCGTEWWEPYGARMKVYSNLLDNVHVKDMENGDSERVVCQTCRLHPHVSIVDRRPL